MARTLKRIGKIALVLFLLLLAFGVWLVGPGNIGRMYLGVGITYDTEPPKVPEFTRPAVLIFSKTNGFRADADIAAANAALEKLAKERGWDSFTTENAAVFNTAQLGKFKAVIWSSTSGDVLTTDQRAAFKDWLEAGGGFVALHGAGGDPSYKWAYYPDQLIRAAFIGHTISPQIQKARFVIEDANHPATKGMGTEWIFEDEIYSFANSPRAKGSRVLISVDESTYSPRETIPLLVDKDISMGKDHPMVWVHCVGNGRVFYSALGHRAVSYSDAKHMAMIGGGIAWAAGLEGPSCDSGKEIIRSAKP